MDEREAGLSPGGADDEHGAALSLGSTAGDCAAHVLLARYDVSELYDARKLMQAMALLPWPERRAKARRFVFIKDKCLCVGTGLLCAYMLRRAGAHDLSMGYGAFNKPYLLHHPTIHFNVSHAGTMAVCAVSSVEVGVDVEEYQPYDEGVARLCYTNEELAWLGQQEDASRAFTRLWTRKESYLKLLGTGLSKPANSFVAIPGSHPEPGIEFEEYDFEKCSACVCTRAQKAITGKVPPSRVPVTSEVLSLEQMMTEDPWEESSTSTKTSSYAEAARTTLSPP